MHTALVSIQKLGHDSSVQFILHELNDLLVYSYKKRMILTVVTHVKPSLNIAGNVFIDIISFNVVNEGGGVQVTQPKVLAIPGLHVVIMEFISYDLTQIKDGLPEVDEFVHYNTGLSHLTPHQVLAEDDS